MFRSPVVEVTATLAPGGTVGLEPGTEVTTAEGSVTIPATSGGGGSGARLVGRVGYQVSVATGTTLDLFISPAAPNQRRCIVRQLVLSCSVAGLQVWNVASRDDATLAVTKQVALLLADLSKAPLVINFEGGLPVNLGDRVSIAIPALAGTYIATLVYDAIFV